MSARTRLSGIALTAAAAAGLAFAALPAAATGRHHHDDGLEASLRPFSEVPAVSSAARGRFKAWHDQASQSIRYELSYSGLEGTVTQGHIHFGQRGVNGGVMVWLCQTATNPAPAAVAATTPICPQEGTVSGVLNAASIVGPAPQGIALTEFAEFLAAIRGGVAYVNVHSSKFAGGEVRGQLHD